MLDTKPKTKEKKENLLAQSSALQVYLDSLLHNVPEFEETDQEETPDLELSLQVDPQEVKREAQKLIDLVAPTVKPVIAPPVISPPSPAPVEVKSAEQLEQAEAIDEKPAEVVQPESNPAESVQQDLRVINCTVGGMKLAIPLDDLGGVTLFNEQVKSVANKPHWVKGLVRHKGNYVHVVDTYELIFPPEKRGQFPPSRDKKQYLIFDRGGHWALICDEVSDVTHLNAEDIKWRSDRGSRQWLAGTVINQLCALIDLKKIGQLLEKGRELV